MRNFASTSALSRMKIGLCLLSALPIAQAAEPIKIVMTAEHWQAKENAEFLRQLGGQVQPVLANRGFQSFGSFLVILHQRAGAFPRLASFGVSKRLPVATRERHYESREPMPELIRGYAKRRGVSHTARSGRRSSKGVSERWNPA